jgi:exosortase/archaeosortase family protein
MYQINKIIASIKDLPTEVKQFLLKATLLFIGWKLLFILVLIPNEVPDAWLVRQLGKGTAFTLNKYYGSADFTSVAIVRKRKYGNDEINATFATVYKASKQKVIGIYQACNGLELMILYTGFIICFAGHFNRKLAYIILGVIGLFLINVLRCSMLGFLSLEHPNHFEFAHKYFFNLVVYALTFILWMFYVSKIKKTTPQII